MLQKSSHTCTVMYVRYVCIVFASISVLYHLYFLSGLLVTRDPTVAQLAMEGSVHVIISVLWIMHGCFWCSIECNCQPVFND